MRHIKLDPQTFSLIHLQFPDGGGAGEGGRADIQSKNRMTKRSNVIMCVIQKRIVSISSLRMSIGVVRSMDRNAVRACTLFLPIHPPGRIGKNVSQHKT